MLDKGLQQLAEKLGGVAIVENGRPWFILLSYAKFQELVGQTRNIEEVPVYKVDAQILDGLEPIQNLLSNRQQELESRNQSVDGESMLLERLNQEISALKEEIEGKEQELGLAPALQEPENSS